MFWSLIQNITGKVTACDYTLSWVRMGSHIRQKLRKSLLALFQYNCRIIDPKRLLQEEDG